MNFMKNIYHFIPSNTSDKFLNLMAISKSYESSASIIYYPRSYLK